MKHRWLYRVYNALLLLALPFILVGVSLRWRRRLVRGMESWSERWGHLSASTSADFSCGRWWWVHAVSLGEAKAIEVFLREAPEKAGVQIFLSLVTPEALSWATEKKLAAVITAAPIDLPWVVRRVFERVRPAVFISVESEFWPNLLREARRSGARVALMNGRISVRSYRSYQKVRSILSALWENFDLFAVRQHEDASRFAELGVPPSIIHVTGNMKYDLPLPEPELTQASGPVRPLRIVIGSSREGEEKVLLPILSALRRTYPTLQTVWAPRHVERTGEIVSLFTSQGLPWVLKSAGYSAQDAHVLWDTMGDLVEAYKQADLAIVGGSFVPKGGQNPIEPAALCVPVVFGPSMENFHGIAEVLVQQKGAAQVTLSELESCLGRLLGSSPERRAMGERARAAIQSRQGATPKTISLLKGLRHA